MTKSGYQLAQRAHFLRGKYIIIHNPKDGWARCLKKNPRFHKLGTVRFVPVPLVVRDPTTDRPTPAYVQFLLRLQGAVQTIGGSPEKIKVVLGPTHGGDDGKITKALNGEVDGAAPYWWTAGDHLRPFYDLGIRCLHWQTCLIGKHLMSMPRVLTKCASPLVVTAWMRSISVTTERGSAADSYIFQGIPLTSTMRKSPRRSWNTVVEIKVDGSGSAIAGTMKRCAKKSK